MPNTLQGSGNSQGDWVTLGAHEVDDLEVVVKHLRVEYPQATIGLWGRSMGAVTALMYAARDPSMAGLVSPFPLPSAESLSAKPRSSVVQDMIAVTVDQIGALNRKALLESAAQNHHAFPN